MLACALALAPAASAATNSTVVGATVPSATNLDASLCAAGMAGRTEFGVVLAGASAVTTDDCRIVFGSSNDDATLRMYQSDLVGVAMSRDTVGDVDTAWGTNGFVRSDLGGNEYQYASAIQPDGKVLVGGQRNGDWLIARYLPTGALDTSFNSPNGYRTLATSAGASEEITAIVVQPDGAIVATGSSNGQLAVARFTATGLLDTTGFNAPTGFLRYNLPGSPDDPSSVALQSTGRIIVGGTSNSWSQAYLVALTPAGLLDASFSGGDGSDGFDVSSIAEHHVSALLVDSSDRIYVASSSTCGCDPRVHRLTVNGAVDAPWGSGGELAIPRTMFAGDATFAHPEGMIFDSSGRLVIVGHVGRPATGEDITITRIHPATATFDGSLGGDGAVTFPVPDDQVGYEIVERTDGSLLVGGSWNDGSVERFLVARALEDGTADPSFGGGDGWATLQPADLPSNQYAGMSVHTDGTVTMVGTANNDIRLARLGSTPVSDYVNLGGGGDSDWSSSASATNMFGACLRTVAGGATTGAGTWTADSASIGDEPAVNADCADGDSDPWNPIATTSVGPTALVARSASTVTSGSADVRFGFRPSTSQPPGRYTASLVIDVVAPAV